MTVELVDQNDKIEIAPAMAGGISHGNKIETLEDAKELNKKFVDWGHTSVFQFSFATFYIEDVSRSLLSQLSRHTFINLLVKSQRYTSTKDDEVIIPDEIKEWAKENEEHRDALDQIMGHFDWFYDRLLDDDIKKENARYFSPIGTSTKLYASANLRAWREFIEIRGLNKGAQKEIRELAQEVLEYLYYEAPSIFEDLIEEYEDNFLAGGGDNPYA